uniref:Stress 70 protein mitochondrial n=1 Tax=Echinococcus granulosus TaxID=6210 RepID=A0A068WG90_ECHGR|nr:stress 70 protein mitochondrial [Echinococcus granulosus]
MVLGFSKLNLLGLFQAFHRLSVKYSAFVGIDLGTTNSCVAYLDNRRPQVIPNANGSRTTPSVVAFVNGNNPSVLVGNPAKRQAMANVKNTIFAVKRLIGRQFNDNDIQHDLYRLPVDIRESSNGEVQFVIGDKRYTPSEISAYILREMKSIAENYLRCEVKDAVITVPAYFNDGQRQATKEAGEYAGLTVHRIINEPTAAALAYGIDKSEDKVVAVYDLGGGTFDISLLDLSKGVFEVRCTNGDTLLGGEDFDNLLVAHIVDKIGTRYVGDDLSALQRIKEAAEEAKIALSAETQTTINLPFISVNESGHPIHFEMKLSRGEYETLVGDLVKRTIGPCEQALNDGEVSKTEVSEVILVGGMTRMPIVEETVRQIFGKEPCKGVNPDEAVALGAAIQAGVLAGVVEDVLLLDVTPLSLGIETLGGAMARLLVRNTAVPARVTQVFSTAVDGQTKVEINIYQGERELARDNKLLGNFILASVDIPPQPRGVPRIEVTFDIDVNGILNVSARDQRTGKEQRLVINSSTGLSAQAVRETLAVAESHAAQDRRRRDVIEASRGLRRLAEDVISKVTEFGDRLPAVEAKVVMHFCQEDVLARVEELKTAEALEELRHLNEDLQKRALDLFQKSVRKTKGKSNGTPH